MGISIHYSGRIADKNKLPKLIEEVEEIANVHVWKYHIYKRKFPGAASDKLLLSEAVTTEHDGELYGIDICPKGSEPVSFCFLSNGRMSSIMQLTCWREYKVGKPLVLYNAEVDADGEVKMEVNEVSYTDEDYKRFLYLCSSKTQYAGSQVHELIIALFRYIAKTYLSDFRMVDEARFWETGDKEVLMQSFDRHTNMLSGFASALRTTDKKENEDIDSYLQRVISGFHKKNLK